MLRYLRKVIRENRRLRRQNADLIGSTYELSTALVRAVARNTALGAELQRTTQLIRELTRG